MTKPTIGRIVLFRFDEWHAATVNKAARELPAGQSSNDVCPGGELPAIITAVHSDTCINLRVFVDGDQMLWATSRMLGDQPGEWHWPVRDGDPS